MTANIVVPELGESVIEAVVAQWLKQEGDRVAAGEPLLSLDTDKVTLEVAAAEDGILERIERRPGDSVKAGDVLGTISPAGAAPAGKQHDDQAERREQEKQPTGDLPAGDFAVARERVTPVARRMAAEHAVDLGAVKPADGGRVTKDDVQRYLDQSAATPPVSSQPEPAQASAQASAAAARPPAARAESGREAGAREGGAREGGGREERRRMSLRRQTIARRLLEAQSSAAMLTTFNEVDMQAVMALRARRKETFKSKHGVSLGLSSFFVKAVVGALKTYPMLNAEIQGSEIILKHYYDIGIAVGAAEGLVVPVLRGSERMSFAEIERQVRDFAAQAEAGKLAIESLAGGTFTITNGGVFGSLLSTPILNPPQVGILGLHGIKDRPVVVDGQIAVRPMMYLALTYDQRIVDGREAVEFLVYIKELVEDPETLLLEG